MARPHLDAGRVIELVRQRLREPDPQGSIEPRNGRVDGDRHARRGIGVAADADPRDRPRGVHVDRHAGDEARQERGRAPQRATGHILEIDADIPRDSYTRVAQLDGDARDDDPRCERR